MTEPTIDRGNLPQIATNYLQYAMTAFEQGDRLTVYESGMLAAQIAIASAMLMPHIPAPNRYPSAHGFIIGGSKAAGGES